MESAGEKPLKPYPVGFTGGARLAIWFLCSEGVRIGPGGWRGAGEAGVGGVGGGVY